MMFKLSEQVEKGWRELRGFKGIPFVLGGKPYHNGTRMEMSSPDVIMKDTPDLA